ncbi:unnamed protein product [Didymodactylos carnosus]|uniref:Uncharacterized protein n=1 Tax=Didymodactylos carnosus TaxID=1234261 RepID=A0A8S2EKK9_9BILA|nr:unnamed protein product [Didymodactylos carnosus]CAF3998198.1 unnamed protein product [Didymodactylos carnosus]
MQQGNNIFRSSSTTKNEYTINQIENLLKLDTNPKHYMILKNGIKRLTSDSWETSGLTSKLQADSPYQVKPGFASCFNCKSTLHYESSTKYMKSHNCIPSTTINEGPLAIYLNNKKVADVRKQHKDQIKQN